MLWTVLLVVVVAIAALLVYAATKPGTFHVRRATRIDAPPHLIHPLIDDFRNWGLWSPYERKDPAMKRVLSGAMAGTGAVYAWDGNKGIGKGSMEITKSSPPFGVTIKLDFVKPFEAHNIVEFSLQPAGEATDVTWSMRGPSTYMCKVIGIFMNMDRMVGQDFESGLAGLKAVAEGRAAPGDAASNEPAAPGRFRASIVS